MWLALVCIMLPSTVARAAVLPGSVSKLIESALEKAGAKAGMELASGKIARDHVLAKWCLGDACSEAKLTAPTTCKRPTGAFCVQWTTSQVPPTLVTSLTQSLTPIPPKTLWKETADRGIPRAVAHALTARDTPRPAGPPPAVALPMPSQAVFAGVLALALLVSLVLAYVLRRKTPLDTQTSSTPPRDIPRFSLALGLVVCLLALGVHHAWPLYVMDMFSYSYTSTSQIVALDEGGKAVQVYDVRAWRCERLPNHDQIPSQSECGPYDEVYTQDKARLAHIRRAPAPTGERMRLRLIRRVWRFPVDRIEQADCPITTCEASR